MDLLTRSEKPPHSKDGFFTISLCGLVFSGVPNSAKLVLRISILVKLIRISFALIGLQLVQDFVAHLIPDCLTVGLANVATPVVKAVRFTSHC